MTPGEAQEGRVWTISKIRGAVTVRHGPDTPYIKVVPESALRASEERAGHERFEGFQEGSKAARRNVEARVRQKEDARAAAFKSWRKAESALREVKADFEDAMETLDILREQLRESEEGLRLSQLQVHHFHDKWRESEERAELAEERAEEWESESDRYRRERNGAQEQRDAERERAQRAEARVARLEKILEGVRSHPDAAGGYEGIAAYIDHAFDQPESARGETWFEPAVTYRQAEVEDALDEALAESVRDARTSIWRSFWDRLTQGGPIPDRPAPADQPESARCDDPDCDWCGEPVSGDQPEGEA